MRLQLSSLFVLGKALAKTKPTPIPLPEWEYWTAIGLIIFLVILGGIVAGLTIGLMSLDMTNIAILKRSGTPTEQRYA